MVGSSEQGVVAPGGVTPLAQVFHAGVSAMESPGLAAERLDRGFGNRAPAAVAPAFTDAVSPERPCDGGLTFPPTWQPLQVFVSPGTNSHQLPRPAPIRRPSLPRLPSWPRPFPPNLSF